MPFEVRELTSEIQEAGIIVQGWCKGLNLWLHIVSLGWAISKRGGNIEKKTRYCGQMFRAGLRKTLKACFSKKRESPLKLTFNFFLQGAERF